MKKTEMEDHKASYHALMDKARSAERNGHYREAIKAAVAAWEYVDGMMQYEQKYGLYADQDKGFNSVSAIEMVLKYAPLLFDFQNLDALENLLKNFRRIEKDTAQNLPEKLDAARARMWNGHRLWNHLEQNPDTRQDELRRILGGDQDLWRTVAEGWDAMGLLRRTPEGGSYRLTMATRMDEVVKAKCSSCGQIAEDAKAKFLEPTVCSKCHATSLFVILLAESDALRRTAP